MAGRVGETGRHPSPAPVTDHATRSPGRIAREADATDNLSGRRRGRAVRPASDLDAARGRVVRPVENADRGRVAREAGARTVARGRNVGRTSGQAADHPINARTGPTQD
jgi:hypothetical protein